MPRKKSLRRALSRTDTHHDVEVPQVAENYTEAKVDTIERVVPSQIKEHGDRIEAPQVEVAGNLVPPVVPMCSQGYLDFASIMQGSVRSSRV